MKKLFVGLLIATSSMTSAFAQNMQSFEAMKVVQNQYKKGHLPSYELLLNPNGFDCTLNAESTVAKNFLSFEENPLGVANVKQSKIGINGRKFKFYGDTFIDSDSAFIQQSGKHYVSIRANEKDRLLLEIGHIEELEQKKEVEMIGGMAVTYVPEDSGFSTKGTFNAVERPDYKALSYLTCVKAAKPSATSSSSNNQGATWTRPISRMYECTYVGKNLRMFTETATNRDLANHKARMMCSAVSDMCIQKDCIEI